MEKQAVSIFKQSSRVRHHVIQSKNVLARLLLEELRRMKLALR